MRTWWLSLVLAILVGQPALAGWQLIAGPETGVPGTWELYPTPGATDDDVQLVAGCLQLRNAPPPNGERIVVRQEPLPDGPWTLDCWLGRHEDDHGRPVLELHDVKEFRNALTIDLQGSVLIVRAEGIRQGAELHRENLQSWTGGYLHWLRLVWTGEEYGLLLWVDGHAVELKRKPPRMLPMRPAVRLLHSTPATYGAVYALNAAPGVPVAEPVSGRAFAGWSAPLRPLPQSASSIARLRAKGFDRDQPAEARCHYLAALVLAEAAEAGQIGPQTLATILGTELDEPLSWLRLACVTAASSRDPRIATWVRNNLPRIRPTLDKQTPTVNLLLALLDPAEGCRRALATKSQGSSGLRIAVAAGPGLPLETMSVLGASVFAHYEMAARAWCWPSMVEVVPEYAAVLERYFAIDAQRPASRGRASDTRARAALRMAAFDPARAAALATAIPDPEIRLETIALLREHFPDAATSAEVAAVAASEAVAATEARVDDRGNHLELYALAAEAWHLAGQTEAARGAYEKATAELRQTPQDMISDLTRLAQLADRLGDRQAADTWWAYAVQALTAFDAEQGRDPEEKITGTWLVWLVYRLAAAGRIDEALLACESTNLKYFRRERGFALGCIVERLATTAPDRAAELYGELQLRQTSTARELATRLGPLDQAKALALASTIPPPYDAITRFEVLGRAGDEAMAAIEPVVRQELTALNGKQQPWLERPAGVVAFGLSPLEEQWKLEPLFGLAPEWFAQAIFETVRDQTGATATPLGAWLARSSRELLSNNAWSNGLPYLAEAAREAEY